jgi:hypothetical protein
MAERLTGVGSETDPIHFQSATLAFLRGYWDAKRGPRAMPSRADIKPSEIRDHLPWMIMVEVLPDLSDFRYRLIGTMVTQYFLNDATGKTIREAFAERGEAATKAVQAMFRKTARDKLPMRSFGDAGWIAPGFEEFEAIYLPLSDDGETVNMILHAFVFDQARVLISREIARANGGTLPLQPAKISGRH